MAEPDNTRDQMHADIDKCWLHPEREAVGWMDITTENGTKTAAGVCEKCRPAPRMERTNG